MKNLDKIMLEGYEKERKAKKGLIITLLIIMFCAAAIFGLICWIMYDSQQSSEYELYYKDDTTTVYHAKNLNITEEQGVKNYYANRVFEYNKVKEIRKKDREKRNI